MTELAAHMLDADLASGEVELGIHRGWWTIDAVEFPIVVVSFAVPVTLYPPGRLTLRIDCTDFPQQAPTAHPIDAASRAILDAGSRPTHGRCAMTFRCDWEDGRALYLPVDRVALNGHPNWRQEHTHEAWDPARGIVQFLRLVRRDLIDDPDAPAVDAA